VLCALADGAEQHGYDLLTALRADPAGAGRIGTGTVYRTLDDLCAAGLVVEAGERPDPAVNPAVPRRHFRGTARGEEARLALATLPPYRPDDARPWRGAVAFGVTWGAGWATGAVATIVTTGAGLLRRAEAA